MTPRKDITIHSIQEVARSSLPVLVLVNDGCTTTCMVTTPEGSSPKGDLHWAIVVLFSNTLPALINLTSLATFGIIFLSAENARTEDD